MNTCGQLSTNNILDSSSQSVYTVPKEDLITHFITREGIYEQMIFCEYSRPNRIPLSQGACTNGNAPVRVSFLSVRPTTSYPSLKDVSDVLVNGDLPYLQRRISDSSIACETPSVTPSDIDTNCNYDRICFNIGRELYVFQYRGVHCAVDLNKPIDKRVYKGTNPTCHDFNAETADVNSCSLIIGFSAGQIQLIDPFQKDYQVSHLYNEDRSIDKTPVTCLKWIPGHPQSFVASHMSGNFYVYKEDLPCFPAPPTYLTCKQGNGFIVYTCKAKTSRNPVYRWSIGTGAIYEFSFSPDTKYLAVVSNDGFLRVFNYHAMELNTFMKSYFGGLLCLSWSPDGRYIVTGGEDDLVTVFSVVEKRVVCRCQGHSSWISQVSFDPYSHYSYEPSRPYCGSADLGLDEDLRPLSLDSGEMLYKDGSERASRAEDTLLNGFSSGVALSTNDRYNVKTTGSLLRRSQKESISSSIGGLASSHAGGVAYRIGSVGHDTYLCLWDLTEDILRQPCLQRNRGSTIISIGTDHVAAPFALLDSLKTTSNDNDVRNANEKRSHKRGFSFAMKLSRSSHDRSVSNLSCERERRENAVRLLGTALCPRMDEVPIIEPLICKKIAHERLTGLEFREDCIVTACQEGFILTWARPGKASRSLMMNSRSMIPDGTVV